MFLSISTSMTNKFDQRSKNKKLHEDYDERKYLLVLLHEINIIWYLK